jgi:LmbE family N-acetylglucosaminyl deacetylase
MNEEKSKHKVQDTVSEGGTYLRAMVVAAHPDDPEFLFGATVAKLARDGTEVMYVICTGGANGGKDPAIPDNELIATRDSEQRAAAAVLGVKDVVILDFSDGRLEATLPLRLAIAREIRRFKPDLVLTHFPHRVLDIPMEASHPDHVAVGEATLSAIYPDAANTRAFPELLKEGLRPHRAREIWIAGNERANHFIDATPYMEKKVEAIRCHRSQLDNASSEVPAWVYHWMKWAGGRPGYDYAEAYRRIEL